MRLLCVLAILITLDYSIVFRVIIPEVVLIQLYSLGWAQSCSKHVEDSNKHIIEETMRQVGYLPELYEDIQLEKYKLWLTLRRLMSYIYIYGAPILDVSRSHTTTQHSR